MPSVVHFRGLMKLCIICLCNIINSFFFFLFGKPDVAKLGPGHMASSERTVVTASCPGRWNLLELWAPVFIHSWAGDEVNINKSFQAWLLLQVNKPGKFPGAWLLWDSQPHIQRVQGMTRKHKHKVEQKTTKPQLSVSSPIEVSWKEVLIIWKVTKCIYVCVSELEGGTLEGYLSGKSH